MSRRKEDVHPLQPAEAEEFATWKLTRVENRAKKIEMREEEKKKKKVREKERRMREEKRRKEREIARLEAMWLSVSRIEAKNTVFIFKQHRVIA